MDYTAPGIQFTRTFTSTMVPWAQSAQHIRRLPPFWTHSYVRVLRLDPSSDLPTELFRGDGSSVPLFALAGHTDVYMASDGSGMQARPGALADEWDVFLADGSIEHYDAVVCSAGQNTEPRPRLGYIEDASGNRTQLDYPDNCADHPDFITGPFGHTVAITYAPFDPFSPTYVEKITDSAGHDIVYGYSNGNTGKLESVTYQDGKTVQYHYEDVRASNVMLLTGVTDEEGRRFSEFGYDFAGRATSTEHDGGDFGYSLTYDPNMGSTTVTRVHDADGNQFDYSLSGKGAGPSRVKSANSPYGAKVFTYEGSKQYRLTKIRDEVQVQTYFYYDDFHKISTLESVVATATRRETTYDYLNDTSNFRTKTTRPSVCDDGTPRFAEEIVTYIPGTQLVASMTNAGFRMNSGVCGPVQQTTTYGGYNSYGQATTIDGPRTDVTDLYTLEYYECTVGGECGQLKSVTNPLGHVTFFDDYDSHGRLLQSSDPNGHVMNYAYDLRGRLLSVTEAPLVGAQRVSSFTYEAGSLLKTATLSDGRVLTYTYNAAHRLTAVEDNLGNRIEYGYDIRGNRNSDDVLDPSLQLTRAVDRTFDARNAVETINAGGFTSTLTYNSDGTLKEERDADLVLTKYTYDQLKRLTRIQDAINGYTDFTYDKADNLLTVKNSLYDTTTYVYDDLGNQLSESSPDRGLTTYDHDAAGNVVSAVDARGKVTTYQYDALNRLTTATFDNLSTISYVYDQNANGIGRLSGVTDATGSVSWLYDPFGAVTQKQQVISGVTFTTSHDYDAAGLLQSTTLPSGKVLSYGYTGHQVTSISANGQVVLSGVTYDPFGPPTGWTWNDLTVSTRDFDLRGLQTSHTLASDTRTLLYDAVGQVTDIDDSRHDMAFDYDVLGRLTNFTSTPIPGGAVLPASQVYSYDKNANRLSLNEAGVISNQTYASTSNRLLSRSGPAPRTYSYDAAGNIIGDGVHTYSYDDRGRLTGVDMGLATYQHNGLGQRVRKDTGSVTLFVYDDAGQLIGEYDAFGNPLQETVWFEGAPVALLTGSDVYYVHTDHLGTPRAITDAGTVIWRWESEPFGTAPADEDPDGDLVNFTFNGRFPGQYFDAETGLHYNYFRTYDPSTGRYLESDPIGLGGGLNTYGYVNQNPLRYTDPTGEAIPVVVAACASNPACAALAIATGIALVDFGMDVADIIRNRPRAQTPPMPPISLPFPISIPGTMPMEGEQCDDDEDKCEKQALADERMCRMMTMPGTGARARCWASVQDRNGACRAGRPLPPLVFW
ncbi:RHS repeat domain-containing protein [Woeseia oceani]|uniref:RHS repeat domain-containing protein n=1 Tax=Woeseia oceani TaxID=1548547 RepID=UPI0018D316F9|nr:RHS repeat-associated core domain-containing protein [Woeseia oceani]